MNLPKQLTTVTSFSKLLAMVLFIAFPILGFWLGMSYQKSMKEKVCERCGDGLIPTSTSIPSPKDIPPGETANQVPYDNPAGWETYRNDEYGFEFRYPGTWKLFPVLDNVFYFGEDYFPDSMFSISIYDTWDEPQQGDCATIDIDNHDAEMCKWRRHIETSHGVQTDYYYTSLDIVVPYNNKRYVIHYSGTDETIENNTRIFNQILSTFVFSY